MFWKDLNKPIYALAPLAGITDSPFRRMCKRFGADVVYSEMVSATALFYNDEKTADLMRFDESERPYVVQLFGAEPKHFRAAARYVTDKIKPDGIDINFGCPVPKVVRQGAGIALFRDIELSHKCIKAVIENTGLPVSVKTRSRAKEGDVLKWLDRMSELEVKAIMIHGRSGSQGYFGPVDTKMIRRAREVFGGVVLANGGVGCPIDAKEAKSGRVDARAQAQELLEKTGADGIGIGQGALGRPWIFKAVRTGQGLARSPRAVKKVALEHADLARKLKGPAGLIEMRKHLSWYVKGLPGAAGLRGQLVRAESMGDIRRVLKKIDYQSTNPPQIYK
jgi:nifR3 family TIM-barrel protein